MQNLEQLKARRAYLRETIKGLNTASAKIEYLNELEDVEEQIWQHQLDELRNWAVGIIVVLIFVVSLSLGI